MSNQPKKEENIEVTLGSQLGSDYKKLAQGVIDQGVTGVINEGERLAISYFRLQDRYLGGNFCNNFFNQYEGRGGAVDGLRAKQIIQAIGASRGGNASNMVDKPNVIARALNPNWKSDIESKGYTVRE